jgi:hypothetical protein
VEAITAEAHRAEKRLRADVDHSLQQLSGELETESELRVKRCAEITSSASQLQSQVDELATSGARTRSLVMEEAVEKLNAVRREVCVRLGSASTATPPRLRLRHMHTRWLGKCHPPNELISAMVGRWTRCIWRWPRAPLRASSRRRWIRLRWRLPPPPRASPPHSLSCASRWVLPLLHIDPPARWFPKLTWLILQLAP